MQIDVPRGNALGAAQEAIRDVMRARGWHAAVILLTNRDGELILTEAELMTLHGTEMS